MAAPRREATKIIQLIRKVLQPHKEPNNPLRFADYGIAERTQPPPDLPDGPAHKLSDNYYFTRDARRDVLPPTEIFNGAQRRLTSGESALESGNVKTVRPGHTFNWETGKSDML
ncbi:hypothetical protein LOTGIDRAFT_235069 [Lottia gigantea]|uniref:NADH dehydrogenase [ubiquinone] 1 alpha subcomplex subunit 7 n=1 Tax=Lottia gigantea TaxID=225164 RepID=V4BFD5_LOTGI|nr:hypothetical protein LOTGIDRAFT_235069 [Lottia gigantea]ESO87619.1 hypothetical protein LOTGIDRAFT_235069 [Lottia gigantea]